MITAKVIEDSISPAGIRLTTLQLMYPRFIHSEVMTHRVFSRNASSSRAIPVAKMIDMVRNTPACPIHWGKNQPGMQADEQLDGYALKEANALWVRAAKQAAEIAELMMGHGLHKQVANRILEPFQHISVVLTATEFDNWRELRRHKDAQPEIQHLATEIDIQMDRSTPVELDYGEWHLPYVSIDERNDGYYHDKVDLLRKISAARCCRVSYLKHDGTAPSIADDLALCDRLAGARPIHASPFEHQATPAKKEEGFAQEGVSHIDLHGNVWSGNFNGWIQHRKLIEASFNS